MPDQPARFWNITLFGSRLLGLLGIIAVMGAAVWGAVLSRGWVAAKWRVIAAASNRPSRPPGAGQASPALPVEDRAAGFWPQWRGPDRTDVSRETGLLHRWPSDGPKLLWTFSNAGLGYTAPAIAGGRLFGMGAYGRSDYLYAIDASTGKELWSTEIGPFLVNGWGDGPRGTPAVDGDRVYALSGQGGLIAADVASGKKLWQIELRDQLQGDVPGWGYTESPLVDGDKVICTPGGLRGALAAIHKETGTIFWRSHEVTDPAAYSSVIVAEVGGVRQYIQMTANGLVGVAAADGRLLWRSDVAHNGTAVIPTPIFQNNQVYATSGYGAGCGLIQLTPSGQGTKAETVYANKIMKNQHGGVVLFQGHVYGYSDDRGWVCQEWGSGKSRWASKKLGKGSLTCADGRLYCYTEEDGTVVLAEASPEEWNEQGRFTIPQETTQERKSGKIWTHPVVAGGRLYLRDQDVIFCYDVKNP